MNERRVFMSNDRKHYIRWVKIPEDKRAALEIPAEVGESVIGMVYIPDSWLAILIVFTQAAYDRHTKGSRTPTLGRRAELPSGTSIRV